MKVHKPRRWTRWQPSGDVVRLLEREYDCDDTLDARRRTLLAQMCNCTERQVSVWFQNKRQRTTAPLTSIQKKMIRAMLETESEQERCAEEMLTSIAVIMNTTPSRVLNEVCCTL